MNNYEIAAESFSKLTTNFGMQPDPSYSESDTRAKIIDQILTIVLGWPERGDVIRREEHVHEGFIDYRLRAGNQGFLLEAKRAGNNFELPMRTSFGDKLSVKNLLHKQKDLQLMYEQVSTYAHESGVQFCVLCNGTQCPLCQYK